jgi:hypothetical protein
MRCSRLAGIARQFSRKFAGAGDIKRSEWCGHGCIGMNQQNIPKKKNIKIGK